MELQNVEQNSAESNPVLARGSGLPDYEAIGQSVYDNLVALNAVRDRSDISFDWFYNRGFPRGESAAVPKDVLKSVARSQLEMVSFLGAEKYLKHLKTKGTITEPQRAKLQGIYDMAEDLSNTGRAIPALMAALPGIEKDIRNEFSQKEQVPLLVYTSILRHSLQYFDEYGFKLAGIQPRECGGSQLGQIAAGVFAAVGGVNILLPSDNTTLAESAASFISLGTIALGVNALIDCLFNIDILNSLLGWLFGGGGPDCQQPGSLFLSVIGCNDFNIRAFGAGNDIVRYDWLGDNTIPATGTTTNPIFRTSAINPTQTISVRVTATCQDNIEFELDDAFFLPNFVNEPPVAIAFTQGPATITAGQTTTYSITQSSQSIYQLSWSSTGPVGLSTNNVPPYSVRATFWASGTAVITATLTNTCNGVITSTSKTVQISN